MQPSIDFLSLIGRGWIAETLLGTWVVMGLLIAFGFFARRAIRAAADPTMPDDGVSLRSIAEFIVEALDGFIESVMEPQHYRELVPFLGSLFLFILAANFLGLIPGMEPPTADSNLTFALGVVCFGFFVYHGIRARGVLGYLGSFLGPLLFLAPLMLPIELVDNLVRPFSLGVRLYANMFADHKVLSIFTGLTKLIVPLVFYTLGSIFCVIQALIFMVLTAAYVKMAASHEH